MVDLTINGGSQTLDGTHTYDYVNITNGGVLYITPYDGTGTTGRLILNAIEVNVDSTSSINGFARGYSGGSRGITNCSGNCKYQGDGGQPSGSGGGTAGNRDQYLGSGGGGGGYGTAGGVGGCSSWAANPLICDIAGGSGGITDGTIDGYDIRMGSGGGGGGGGDAIYISLATDGSNGGAMLTINADNINIQGTLDFNGGPGGVGAGLYAQGGGGGGGASGGGILLYGTNINISGGRLLANGGDGGLNGSIASLGNIRYYPGGSNGGGGRIKIFYKGTYNDSGATASAGTVYTTSSIPVIFNSYPQGATIIIDGVEQIPKTNTQIDLFPGVYNYILRLECYEDITGQITVTSISPTTISGSFVKNTGDLSITSQPPGANVYFGITLKGQTPLSYTCYPEGVQDYYISLLGYQAFTGTVDIIRNLLTEVNATLAPVGPAGLGSIYIMSTPPGATIFLDDINIQQITPYAIINIPIGPHTIRLEKNGYNQWTSLPITVGDNQTSSITANLTIVDNICSWIESNGGWTSITAYDIMTLVNAYLRLAPLGFIVTMAHINGAISYYLDIVDSGNAYTGCQFA